MKYETSDYWLAGALLGAGRKLLSLRWEGGRAFFIFENFEDCQTLERAFWTEDLSVGARAYASALRTLKDRLFANPNNSRNHLTFSRNKVDKAQM
jgi:hypothetical protein